MMRYVLPLIVVLLIVGCSPEPRAVPRFFRGEIVESVIDGQRGQITVIRCYETGCKYFVRFKSINGHKWGKPYSEVFMKEFEIKKVR